MWLFWVISLLSIPYFQSCWFGHASTFMLVTSELLYAYGSHLISSLFCVTEALLVCKEWCSQCFCFTLSLVFQQDPLVYQAILLLNSQVTVYHSDQESRSFVLSSDPIIKVGSGEYYIIAFTVGLITVVLNVQWYQCWSLLFIPLECSECFSQNVD